MRTWHASQFGAYLKICSTHTLEALHRHWELYAAFSSLPQTRIDKLYAEQRRLSVDVLGSGLLLSTSRSAGIFWLQAMGPMQELFKCYWTTGTTFSSTQDLTAAKKLNPTFAYNLHGEGFGPHYGTFPPQAYHLTEAFAPILGDGRRSAPIDVVKDQSRSWCRAFQTARSSPGGPSTIGAEARCPSEQNLAAQGRRADLIRTKQHGDRGKPRCVIRTMVAQSPKARSHPDAGWVRRAEFERSLLMD
ncbi:hypothetical protein C8Q72DRAFT_597801 [Fomitopsis betulina]|nr:hypothetical protein C8Q72DRAFT_597801 [Fomitopsis betulina]